MKFQEYLVPNNQDHQKRHDLEKEVLNLKAELEGEQTLNKVLTNALNGPVRVPSMPWLPPEVRVVVKELEMVEQQIILLERKVKELKLRFYQEKGQKKEWEIEQQKHRSRKPVHNGHGSGPMLQEQRCRSRNYEEYRNGKHGMRSNRRPSLGSALDVQGYEISRRSTRKVAKQCSANLRSSKPLHSF